MFVNLSNVIYDFRIDNSFLKRATLNITIINIKSSSVGSQAGRAEKPFRCGHNDFCHMTDTPLRSAWFYIPRLQFPWNLKTR